ncbi:MAG: 4-hydroxy-tetrahydrodipicolinate synthase [Holosporales bacterium]|jgi:4-hydroxy-tetrahydrodipicolinate synthase|nr:4-hydroxy-tetrahydrodipicolinate synthase [Holosporales bacterium]
MFSGSNVALVTPFHNNILDLEALERLINWQIESGTDGILVTGTTGEGQLLTSEERKTVINISREIIRERAHLTVGCSAISAIDTIRIAKEAEDCRADGILAIVPYYIKPTQTGIFEFFANIHENCDIPIIMYNNPGRCCVSMNVDTVIKLASSFKRIVALKDSSVDLTRVPKIKRTLPGFTLLSGDDPSLAGYMTSGGNGTISVVANVAPKMAKKMVTDYSPELNIPWTYLSEAMFTESNPIPVKFCLSKMGIIKNELRSPLTVAGKITEEAINSVMDQWDFC